jgi:hypothetical protein
MGWSLRSSIDREGKITAPLPFFCIVILFTIQMIFGIIASHSVSKDILSADKRALVLLHTLSEEAGHVPKRYETLIHYPEGLHTAINLTYWTLVSNLLFWLIVSIVVLFLWRRGKPVAGSADP